MRYLRFVLILALGVAGCRATRPSAPPATPTYSLSALQNALAIADSAQRAYRAKNYVPSAQQYERAAQTPGFPGAASAWYNAACSWALAGDRVRAVAALERALDDGWRNADHLKRDSDLSLLHGTAEWSRIVARADALARAYATERGEVTNVKLVTADIANFWRAYDLAAAETAFVAKRAIFQREYFDRASVGLIDYYMSKIRNVDNFTRFVTRQRRFYDAVRPQTLRVPESTERIREGLVRLKELYPEATFPDVYFVIGMLTSGGTASQNGLLIGTEMYSTTPATPKDELEPGIALIVGTADKLSNTVVHELVHFLQGPGDGTLLSGAIREGTAVYLAQLAVPLERPDHFMTWGRAHEQQVRERFTKEMSGKDMSQWIGNNSRASADWPADLGYFIGYRIAEEYVQRSADKKQAIRELLRLEDPRAILKKSGYIGGRDQL